MIQYIYKIKKEVLYLKRTALFGALGIASLFTFLHIGEPMPVPTPDEQLTTTHVIMIDEIDHNNFSKLDSSDTPTVENPSLKGVASINGVESTIINYTKPPHGDGVPLRTSEAYHLKYGAFPENYYAIDYTNSSHLGLEVLALKIGDQVYLDGKSYTMIGETRVFFPQATTDDIPVGYNAYLQTCWSNNRRDGMRIVLLK